MPRLRREASWRGHNRGEGFAVAPGFSNHARRPSASLAFHLAVAFAGSATVAADEGIAIAVAIDIGQHNAGNSVGRQAANWVLDPSAICFLSAVLAIQGRRPVTLYQSRR